METILFEVGESYNFQHGNYMEHTLMMTQIIMHTFHVEYSSNEFCIHSIECVHTHSCEGYVPENSCQSDRPHLSSLSIQCMNVQKMMTANAYVCVYNDT